jgi:WD repeat-containing protein 68
MYESEELSPLLRLCWNRMDPNYIATILTSSSKAIILDIRAPSIPVTELAGHDACLNSVCWAPHSNRHIATCSDDKQAFIWDVVPRPRVVEEPILAYMADGEVILDMIQCFASPSFVCHIDQFSCMGL